MKKIFYFLLFLLPLLSFSQKVTMNFDSLTDFSTSFGSWQVVDLDSSATYGFQSFGFPNNTQPMAFITFNPQLTTPTMDTVASIQPHSAPRFGACFGATTPPNDDWFISPKVTLKYGGKFSVWVKSYTGQYGLERYKVLVSTTDSLPSSFHSVSGLVALEAPLVWTLKTFSLSEYANQQVYVAVQCASNDAFVFMIDDLEIDLGSDTPTLPSSLTENFENFNDFTKDFTPWTTEDINGGVTYSIEAHTFPHSGEPMAYIVFNPAQVTPPMINPGIQPHSGSRFAACFASMPGHTPNNKWLISPRMTLGNTPKIRLWTETFNPTYGMEKFNICVSTKTNNPADFVVVSGSTPLEAPMNWGSTTIDLSAYKDSTVYVGIQCVSDDTFIFMVDDIEIGSSVGTADKDPFSDVTIRPNPSSGKFYIHIGQPLGLTTISVLNIDGKKIASFNNPQEIDLTGYSEGMYFLLFHSEKGDFTRKIIIKN